VTTIGYRNSARSGSRPIWIDRPAELNLLVCCGVVWDTTSAHAAEEKQMKFMLLPVAFAFLIAAGWAIPPAQAAGCLKGAAVGGVAGHYAGHHGLIGAGVGCAIGHHEAAKHAREKAEQQQQQGSNGEPSSNSGH
jgi:hypothetical protein